MRETWIVKVGGSLFDLPDLREKLADFVDRADAAIIFVAGGGAAADIVREWDRRFDLGEQISHHLAIRAMDFNIGLMESFGYPRVGTREETLHKAITLDVPTFLRGEETASGEILPASWDVTSDSIAAWIATRWPADRLVLLKSVDEPSSFENSTAVDAYFASLVRRFPAEVEWLNCREMSARERI